MLSEILLIVLLMVLNGVFSMSEIAVVSSRKSRLQQQADAGDRKARHALQLAEDPTRFLSTVQIGITLIGILAGAFGGATVAESVAAAVRRSAVLAPYANGIGLAVVVLGITFLSLVVGELVPKRIGLNNPERIAARIAGPMHLLSRLAAPLVWVLTGATEILLRFLGIQRSSDPPVTEAEITGLIEQGTQAGVFEEGEQDMVERVFWLGDQRVGALLTPRHRVVWLDVEAPAEDTVDMLFSHRHSRYVVCEGEIDRVIGMVEVKDLLADTLIHGGLDLRRALKAPLFLPESTRALRVLEMFRDSGARMAVVIDEYGGVEGVITLNDVLEEIAGNVGATGTEVVRRDDGSWLVDGAMAMEDLRETLGMSERRAEDRHEYRTVGGFVVTHLGRIPAPGTWFQADGFRFEVMDMDGHRVDKVLVRAEPHEAH
jgi:putative hemolysin